MTPRGGASPPPAAPCGEGEAQSPLPPQPLQRSSLLAAHLLAEDPSTLGDMGRSHSMSASPDMLHRPSLEHSISVSSAPNLSAPPPPPADFNPPADFSSELPLHGIVANPLFSAPSSPPTQPPTLLPNSPTRPTPVTRVFSPSVSPPTRPSPAASPPTGLLPDDPSTLLGETLSGRLQRPQLRSIQQISSESVNISQRSSSPSTSIAGGSSASASESGDVLALRRDELVSNILSAEDEWTRRSASSAPQSPTLEETEESGGLGGRPRSMSRGEETHAWDSVWPAPNAVRRGPGFDLPGPSRFPMAPMSPYVTPSFSPAIVQQAQAQAQTAAAAAWALSLSTSPPIDSERPGPSSPGHRPSLPLAIAPRHSSSRHSLHFEFEDVSHSSSPPSPRGRRLPSLPSSPQASPVPELPKTAPPRPRPILEDSKSSRRSPSSSSGSPPSLSSRSPAVSGSPASSPDSVSPIPLISDSPPIVSPGPRPAALGSHFPELVPPFISRRELPPRLTRRVSETAIVRRPDASLLLAGQAGASSSITTHNEPDGDMDDDELLLSPRRPGVPRRAKSAQDAHGGTRSVHPALPLSVPGLHLTSLDDEVFEMDDDDHEPEAPNPCVSSASAPYALGIVDEGDCLPTESAMLEMDVTFDDEGLNALERIFLLSRSEYPFHRAYVARVLGDLLGDVDPCESVEYVLPLITAFSFDEDETVKEAFAEDLHRILWYYFTTCQLVSESSTESPGPDALPDSVQRLENMHPTQPLDQPQSRPCGDSGDSGLSNFASNYAGGISIKPGNASSGDMSTTATSNLTGLDLGPRTEDTPGTSLTPSPDMGPHFVEKYEDQVDDKLWEGDKLFEGVPEVVSAPELHVGFFRPLLGTMLLSHNELVANPTRDGIIALVSRLRGGPVEAETWGTERDNQDTEVHLSQTGPHLHHKLPFGPDMRQLVEQELLYGIVLGMGTLSTEVPDSLFNDTTEVVGDGVDQDYEAEMYRLQMIQEATLGRALSLSFIGAMSELYSPEEVVKYGFIDEVIRGQDGDVSTRAEAALAIGKVVRAAPPEEVPRLLEAFQSFATDKNPAVLQSACSSLASLCKRAPSDEYRREFAVTAMQGFMTGNENVQYAALEALGEVIYTFVNDPLGPPPELLQIFCEERPPTIAEDCDWTFLAAFNLPGVCLTVGPDRWGELRGLYRRIVGQAGTRVLRTVAASLHELANILHPEQVAEDVLPVYRQCLTYGDDIRESIFEHVDVLIARLPQSLGWECFMDLSTTWEKNMLGGWRAREQLALHIPSFLETFHRHSEVSAVLGMMHSALLDPFAAVRDAATVAVPRSFEILGRSMCSQNVLNDMLLDLGFSSSYRQRLTFVRCLREFIRPPPNREVFEKSFMPSLMRLSQDIVDVRLGLAKAVADLFIIGAFYGDRKLPVPQEVRGLARVLSEDDSPDVRAVISGIGADRWEDLPAEEALEEELATSSNPNSVESAVEQVMEDSSPTRAVVEQRKGLHDRALLPSPLAKVESPNEPEQEDEDRGENPFAASFGRAASASN